MQKTIINTLQLFLFDTQSLQQQFIVEKNTLLDLLRAKYDDNTATAKYNTIINNIKQYFLQMHNIIL